MKQILSILWSVALFFLLLTVAIGLPIYVRPFYYAHIDALHLEQTGFTETEIRQAYDEVLDYLTKPNKPFGMGVFKFSEEGASHFADCKVLFDLNLTIMTASAATLMLIVIIRHFLKLPPLQLGHLSPTFYAGAAGILLPLLIGGLASLDFDRAFTIFHSLFFPGKDNWIFNAYTDEIILVLPQEFFRNCAILIGAALLIFSLSAMIGACLFKRERVK